MTGDSNWVFEATIPHFCHGASTFQSILNLVADTMHYETNAIHTTSLDLRHSQLVYLFNHNIASASSSKKEVRVTDMYFLHKLECGLGDIVGLPLLATITRAANHKNQKKTFPYSRSSF